MSKKRITPPQSPISEFEPPEGREVWKNRIVGEGTRRAGEFLANAANWRIHPLQQQEGLSGVLKNIGWVQRVIVNKTTGNIVDGHLRVSLALTEGEDTLVPYIEVELTPNEEAIILATIDPIAGLAATDTTQLAELIASIQTGDAEIASLLDHIHDVYELPNDEPPPKDTDPGAAMDYAETLRQKYGVGLGQLWVIGRHKLICGDAYDPELVSLLMDGNKADMLHIDPPYGISIVDPANASAETRGGITPHKNMPPGMARGAVRSRSSTARIVQGNEYPVIQGDDRPFDPTPFLGFAKTIIMWGANNYADKLPISSGWICWDKRENITRNDFSDGELAWTNHGNKLRIFYHLWNGLHKGSQWGEKRLHPTEKPVALYEHIGREYCGPRLWVDLFAGSGAQLVAAENVGATCYGMEIEPLYVAVILERLAGLGLEPRRVK